MTQPVLSPPPASAAASGTGALYDGYWRTRARAGGLSGHRPRYDLFARWIGAGASVLDLGCGDGAFGAFVVQQRRARYLGCDVSPAALELAHGRGLRTRRLDLDDASAVAALGAGAFDHVVLSEVVEHVVHAEDLLRAAGEVAAQSVLVSIPNIAYWPYRLQLLRGTFPRQWAIDPREHLRFWSVRDFARLAAGLGFRVDEIAASNGRPVLRDRWPNLFGSQVCFRLVPRRTEA